jgi:hypothetical protein
MLTTNQKGAVAEMAIAAEAMKLGVGVYLSAADERADLIFDLRPRLIRVQCKWAACYGDVMVVRLYSARRARDGLRRTLYTDEDVDAFAAYSSETGRCYFFPFSEVADHGVIQLRIRPTRNNQTKRIRWARDSEFTATLRPLLGAVAQLGERLAGSQ